MRINDRVMTEEGETGTVSAVHAGRYRIEWDDDVVTEETFSTIVEEEPGCFFVVCG